MTRVEANVIHMVAVNAPGVSDEGVAALRSTFPRPLLPSGGVLDEAIREGRVVSTTNSQTDVRATPPVRAAAAAFGYRALLIVPMLRDNHAIGTINIARPGETLPSENQTELLKTFAAQAVIAIENLRLFKELQERNRELTTALDTQTATSDILRVISRSRTNVQPVFDAILASAVRLLRGYSGVLTRIAGDQIELAAHTSTDDAGDAALAARG